MKIVVKRNEQEQEPEVTIDLKDVYHPYAVRDAIKLALDIDGFTEKAIAEVFNQLPDAKSETS